MSLNPVSETIGRRRFLQGLSAAMGGLACASMTGCVPAGSAGDVELVWGRRGQSEGRFLKPRAITIDRFDQLYIVDTTGRIQVFDRDGQWLRQWKTPQTKNGRPTGMAMRRGDTPEEDLLLVADTHYYRMLVYNRDGERLKHLEIGGTAGRNPGEFAFVTDAVADRHGCVYVGEYGDSDRIQKFDPNGDFMLQWGGTGSEVQQFVRPQSLVVDGDTLWIADACNHRIQRYDLSTDEPTWMDVWGGQGTQPGKFHYPYDLAVLEDGGLLVCEYGNQRIQRLSADGEPIGIWGAPGFEIGQLYQPWGLVIDSRDRLHVLDSNNHRIQRCRIPSRIPELAAKPA
ncbi:MAG: NHL repeat-containing protein [Planctomycetota bacterium]